MGDESYTGKKTKNKEGKINVINVINQLIQNISYEKIIIIHDFTDIGS